MSLFSVSLMSIAQKTASQKSLRNCSKAVWSERLVYINEFGGGGFAQSTTHSVEGSCYLWRADVSIDFSAFLGMRRCKKLVSENFLLTIPIRSPVLALFLRRECLIPDLHFESLTVYVGCVK